MTEYNNYFVSKAEDEVVESAFLLMYKMTRSNNNSLKLQMQIKGTIQNLNMVLAYRPEDSAVQRPLEKIDEFTINKTSW